MWPWRNYAKDHFEAKKRLDEFMRKMNRVKVASKGMPVFSEGIYKGVFTRDIYQGEYFLNTDFQFADGTNPETNACIPYYVIDSLNPNKCKQDSNIENDTVSHPAHYTAHASGIECIQITEHMNFCRGNAIKYIWRAGSKGNEVEDLKKAIWYLEREITRISK